MANDQRKLIADWFKAWNSRDAENIASFYTEDGSFEEVPTGKIIKGKNELISIFKNIFIEYPDLTCEQKSAFYSPNAVCGEFIMSGTQTYSTNPAVPATGKRISVGVAFILELQQDKIKRHTDYFDGATIARQLGLA